MPPVLRLILPDFNVVRCPVEQCSSLTAVLAFATKHYNGPLNAMVNGVALAEDKTKLLTEEAYTRIIGSGSAVNLFVVLADTPKPATPVKVTYPLRPSCWLSEREPCLILAHAFACFLLLFRSVHPYLYTRPRPCRCQCRRLRLVPLRPLWQCRKQSACLLRKLQSPLPQSPCRATLPQRHRF